MKKYLVIFIERGEKQRSSVNAESEADAALAIQGRDPNNNILDVCDMGNLPFTFVSHIQEQTPFRDAEKIVKEQMLKTHQELKASHKGDPYISLALCYNDANWRIYPADIGEDKSCDGKTLAEAMAKIQPPKSPEEIKAERKAKLLAELAELELEDKKATGLKKLREAVAQIDGLASPTELDLENRQAAIDELERRENEK